MHVAIGLPKFFLEAANSIPTLIATFLVILIVIPGGFFYLYSKSVKQDDSKIISESLPMYQMLLNENMTFMNLPKIMSLTTNFHEFVILSSLDAAILNKLGADYLKEESPKIPAPKPGQQYKIELGLKAHFLILAYLR